MYQVRRLTDADIEQRWMLGAIAFGYRDRTMPMGFSVELPGRRTWGVFDGARLVAQAVDRAQHHWYGGRRVPASGVASVATVPEVRGRGLARTVLTALLADARDRGAAISKLFYTTPVPYRALGWEEIGTLDWRAVPTSTLATVQPPAGVTLRPATPADIPATAALFTAWAAEGNGMMDRSGEAFTANAADILDAYDGTTLAIGASGEIDGYAAWDRNPGYDEKGRVTVTDLVTRTPEATAALLAMLAGWVSSAPTIAWCLPDGDPAYLQGWFAGARVERRLPWMLRVIDAPAAVAARGWPRHLSGYADVALADDACPWNTGAYRLVIADGEARLEPGGSGAAALTPRGLALWYAGAATPATLRRAGMLTGDASADEFLAAATAGPRARLHDYF